MKLADKLVRENIRNLQPYSSARSTFSDLGSWILLDANESPYPPGREEDRWSFWNRYPDPQPAPLRQRLSSLYGVETDQILLSRGSDEAIELITRTFCQPQKDKILITPPTFGMYSIAAKIQDLEIVEVPLPSDFEFPTQKVIETAREKDVKMVCLCSPNNPTGNSIPEEDLLLMLRELKDRFVLVDEAYIEFSGNKSLASKIEEFDNLILLRTLSKFYGLAGLRIGITLAESSIIGYLRKTVAPYPIAQPCIQLGLKALEPESLTLIHSQQSRLVEQRDFMARNLGEIKGIRKVYPSDTNFLLIDAENSADLIQELKSVGVIVRDQSRIKEGLFRMSIGQEQENIIALTAFCRFYGHPEPDQKKRAIREVLHQRKTKETSIKVLVNLDQSEPTKIDTGIGFLDHMLEQIARHGNFSLVLSCVGDLHIDDHHSIEDIAITLGEAIKKALGNKLGVARYGFTVPMDEARCECSIDLSGRSAFVLEGDFGQGSLNQFNLEMAPHFFQSFSQSLGCALHMKVVGENSHHRVESAFKALGRCLRQAVELVSNRIESSKGSL